MNTSIISFVFSYRLCMPERKVFEPNEAVFIHEEMDSYNWNYLDQHICGDQEFNELMEVNPLLVLLTEGAETSTVIFIFSKCNCPIVLLQVIWLQNWRGCVTTVWFILFQRFSCDLEMKTRKQNRNNERTEIERFDWFIQRIQTRVDFWLVKGTLGWENFMPENFLEIPRYFALTSYCNTISQSNNAFAISYSYLTGKQHLLSCLYFIHARKIYVREHV